MKVGLSAQAAGSPSRARRLGVSLAVLIGLLAAGCSSTSEEGGGGGVISEARDTVRGLYGLLLGAVTGATGLGSGPPGTQSLGQFTLKCPEIEVRAGASHYIFYAPNEPSTPKAVRYQGTITQTARECEFKQESVKFKFGFAGRVLLGPRGKEASVVMPVRALLAWRDDQVAWTKLYKVPVTVEPGAVSGFFVDVEEDFDYLVPEGHRLSEYRLYIGFDGQGGTDKGVPVAKAQDNGTRVR